MSGRFLSDLNSRSVFPQPLRLLLRGLTFCIAVLLSGSITCARAGTPRPEPQPAKPELTDDDLSAIDEMFDKVSDGFLRGDAETVKRVLAESDERNEITRILKQEFKEAQYLDFRVGKVNPDSSIPPNRHSLDATIRTKLLYIDDPHSPDSRKPIENTTFQNFIVQRYPDGPFKIVNSSLFDNMGRRRTGMSVYIRAAQFIMLVLALLAVWVTVGYSAWAMRPKSVAWRCVAVVPGVGTLLFLIYRFWPKKQKERRPGSSLNIQK